VKKITGAAMGYLLGLKEYLDETYSNSIFDQAIDSKQPWEMFLHGHRIIKARVVKNLKYDLKVVIESPGDEELPKIQIKLLYPAELSDSIRPLIKVDKETEALGLSPILSPHQRYFIKNKSLFPLMKKKEVVIFTLLEGEIIRGIIAGFSRYDITVNVKGGMPVTLLRHSIYDLRDKKARCFLKSFQEEHRDWQKSDLFVP
jgi:hypothetical protein